jgi:regulator of protease activity HflC (stomatin/prohibitin superfamily)
LEKKPRYERKELTTMSNYSVDHPDTWQTRFDAKENAWADLQRSGTVIIPILLLWFWSTVFVLFYIILNKQVLEKASNYFVGIFTVARVVLTLLAPSFFLSIGIWMVFQVVTSLFNDFYQPPNITQTGKLIQRRLFGVIPLPSPLSNFMHYPFVVFDEPKLDASHWYSWLGGPAILVIYDGTALYLERGNRFSRVVGPGNIIPFMDRFETIYAVVDLRPCTITRSPFRCYTKDGIPIKVEMRITCQIRSSQLAKEKSKALVYPFDPVEVRKAVESTVVRYDKSTRKLQESDWMDGLWGRVSGKILAYIAAHRIDELFVEYQHLNDEPPISEDSNEENEIPPTQILSPQVSKKFIELINDQILVNDGSKVLDIEILHVLVPPDVKEQRIEFWKAERTRLALQRLGKSAANNIRYKELADAEAQRSMLRIIIKSIEEAASPEFVDTLIISFSYILNQTMSDEFSRSYFGAESLNLLEKIRKIVGESSPSEENP